MKREFSNKMLAMFACAVLAGACLAGCGSDKKPAVSSSTAVEEQSVSVSTEGVSAADEKEESLVGLNKVEQDVAGSNATDVAGFNETDVSAAGENVTGMNETSAEIGGSNTTGVNGTDVGAAGSNATASR